jgi:beta-lactamase regulating signal transducer with metallopeptidase domain
MDAAIKGLVILSLTGLAVLAMRRASAAARHLVWFLGTLSLLILPIFSAALPGWHILPGWTDNIAAPEPMAARAPLLVPIVPENQILPDEPAPRAQPPISVQPPAAPKPLHVNWQTWVLLAWLAGSALLLGHVALGFASLGWLQRRSSRITIGGWPTLLRQLCDQLGFRRPVQLLSSPHRAMPMTWGIWRTRLLLPEDSTMWSNEQRRTVLLHELAHAKRWDCLTQLVVQLACAVYWFNPLLWLAWKGMQAEREQACDDLVLSTGTKASAYAEQLLHIASEMPAVRYSAAAIAMARPSKLEDRLLAILDVTRNRRDLTRWGVLIAAAAAMALIVPMACMKAAGQRQQAAMPPTTEPATELYAQKLQELQRVQVKYSNDLTSYEQALRELQSQYNTDDLASFQSENMRQLGQLSARLDDAKTRLDIDRNIMGVNQPGGPAGGATAQPAPLTEDQIATFDGGKLNQMRAQRNAIATEIARMKASGYADASPRMQNLHADLSVWDQEIAAYVQSVSQGYRLNPQGGGLGLTSVRAEIVALKVTIDDLTKQLERQKALCADVGKYSQFIRDVKSNMARAQQGYDNATAEYERLQGMHDPNTTGQPPATPAAPSTNAFRVRHFVMLVIAPDGNMTFQGSETNWEKLPTLLEQVPDRGHTVLCLAWTSDQVTVGQLNEARVGQLAQQLGFEYLSNVGEHPLGSMGGPDKLIEDVKATQAGSDAEPLVQPVNKALADFPEALDLSTPQSAWAAWQRACLTKNGSEAGLSWVKLDPEEEKHFWQQQERGHPNELAIYVTALAKSKLIEVWVYRGELAETISYLPFPEGKGTAPYSLRSFGLINGTWKNLGEDRCGSLVEARVTARAKAPRMWSYFLEIKPSPATPPTTQPAAGHAAAKQEPGKTISLYVHNGVVQMRMGDKILEAARIEIDPVGGPGFVVEAHDGRVRLRRSNGDELIGDRIEIASDGQIAAKGGIIPLMQNALDGQGN